MDIVPSGKSMTGPRKPSLSSFPQLSVVPAHKVVKINSSKIAAIRLHSRDTEVIGY